MNKKQEKILREMSRLEVNAKMLIASIKGGEFAMSFRKVEDLVQGELEERIRGKIWEFIEEDVDTI